MTSAWLQALPTAWPSCMRARWLRPATAQIFYEHKHPYTEALLQPALRRGGQARTADESIPGTPPDLLCPPKGCGFAARCRHCMQICHEEQPPEFDVGGGHKASCWLLRRTARAQRRGDDQ